MLPTVFDPTTIRIREEESRVLPLLRRSRDIRLLALLARFQILAGKARGFAESVEAIARLLQARTESAIPTTQNGNRARYDALETLANTTWVVMPLRYLPLTGNPEVTLRRYHVATGKAAPRAEEEDLSAAQILEQLRSPATRAVTEAIYGDVTRAAAALTDIADICSSLNRAIDYSSTLDVLEDIQALIRQALPDLQAKVTPAAGSEAPAHSPASHVQRPPGASEVPAAAELSSSAEVRATLAAAETYLARHEPSSAALLLVTQARQLVGRPLVEALEALLPTAAAKAAIDFGPSVGFRLSMDRMKALTGATFPRKVQPPVLHKDLTRCHHGLHRAAKSHLISARSNSGIAGMSLQVRSRSCWHGHEAGWTRISRPY